MAKFFTAQTAGSLKIDRAGRRINGIAIASLGKANGEPFDATTLQMIADLGNAGTIRARFDHPNRADPQEVEQTLDNLLGEFTAFRVDGEVCRADAQFAGVNVDKEDTVLGLAEKTPHLFGVSIVIDEPAPPKGQRKKDAACRPSRLFAVDFVDLPSSNAAGLFAASKAAEGNPAMDPVDIYAKDGQLFCSYKGEEIPLNHTAESVDCTKALVKAAKAKDGGGDDPDSDDPETEAKKKAMKKDPTSSETQTDPTPITASDVEKARQDAITAERARRKTFSTILSAAGVTDAKDVEELEEFYEQGLDEKQLKFLASRTIGTRARAVGEGSGNHESHNKKPLEGVDAELAKVEESAGKRFDEEQTVRRSFGLLTNDRESDAWKTARGRYVANSRRRYLAEKK